MYEKIHGQCQHILQSEHLFTKLHLSHLQIFLLSTTEFYVHVVEQSCIRLDLIGIIFCKFLYFL
jgi:hypothetical protein